MNSSLGDLYCMRALIGLSLAVLSLSLSLGSQMPVHADGGFPFTLTVLPNPIPANTDDAAVVVTTLPGATCTARILYTRKHPHSVSFDTVTIPSTGAARWILPTIPR